MRAFWNYGSIGEPLRIPNEFLEYGAKSLARFSPSTEGPLGGPCTGIFQIWENYIRNGFLQANILKGTVLDPLQLPGPCSTYQYKP